MGTKEEAAVWRREQRRKRNRQGAAASRQRQRDRITELEGELEGWKTKYAELMAKISSLEGVVPESSDGEADSEVITDLATSEEIVDKIFMSVPSCVPPPTSSLMNLRTESAPDEGAHEVSEESEE